VKAKTKQQATHKPSKRLENKKKTRLEEEFLGERVRVCGTKHSPNVDKRSMIYYLVSFLFRKISI